MSLGLAIVGYGKMGRLIELLAPEYGFEVRAKFNGLNNAGGEGLTRESLRGIDAAVEFSTPQTAARNIERWPQRALMRRRAQPDGWSSFRRYAKR
jgi:hypothetical protein